MPGIEAVTFLHAEHVIYHWGNVWPYKNDPSPQGQGWSQCYNCRQSRKGEGAGLLLGDRVRSHLWWMKELRQEKMRRGNMAQRVIMLGKMDCRWVEGTSVMFMPAWRSTEDMLWGSPRRLSKYCREWKTIRQGHILKAVLIFSIHISLPAEESHLNHCRSETLFS